MNSDKYGLITCEFSGMVREAFNAYHGNRFFSCDFLPAEDGRKDCHIQGDAMNAIQSRHWHLIGIHYTCTYFCNSGVRWLYQRYPDGRSGHSYDRDPVRWQKMQDAALEFANLWSAAIKHADHVYFENPTMHSYAVMEIQRYFPPMSDGIGFPPAPTQRIQPCDFGHPETKATGLWLHNLPPLRPTKIVRNEMALLPKKERTRVHFASPGKDRWKERSRTLPGIAAAMAEQWGPLL